MSQKKTSTSAKTISFLIAIFIFTIAFVLSVIAKPTQTETNATGSLSFPQDHASHPSYLSEWWYINILTASTIADGTNTQNYANIVSFSRINGVKNLLTSFANTSSNSFTQRTLTNGTLTAGLNSNSLLTVNFVQGNTNLKLEQLSALASGKKRFRLTGTATTGGRFDLMLTERTVPISRNTTPLLWGCTGNISVFAPNDTYYYSMPDWDVSGTFVTPAGQQRYVKAGKAWIDHQWFSSLPPADWQGHYWTSAHFSPNQNIYDTTTPHDAYGYVKQVYNSGPKYTYWVHRKADGTNECGSSGQMYVSTYSSTNGYPMSSTLTLQRSSGGTTFANQTFYPTADNQVFIPPSGPAFFEAASNITSRIDGKTMYGAGFFETHLHR